MALLINLVRTVFLLFLVAAAAALVARLLTAFSIKLAEKRQLVAEVNERSSHSVPTPRIGGVGLVGGLLVGFALLGAMMIAPGAMPAELRLTDAGLAQFGWVRFAAALVSLVLAFALGLWDDAKNPHPGLKLAGQVVIALVPPLCGIRMPGLHVPGMAASVALPAAVSVALTAAWLLLMMNVVNFMDGINGLAGRFAQWTAIFTFLGPFGFGGAEILLPLCAALYGASEGFLRYNHPKAQTFLGDCGSQPLGLFAGLLGVLLTQLPTSYPLPFVGFLLIVAPFVHDVVYTLIARAMAGKNILSAHREHLYQQFLVNHGENHGETLAFVENALICCGLAGAAYVHFAYAGRGSTGIFGLDMTILQLGLIALVATWLAAYTAKARRPGIRAFIP